MKRILIVGGGGFGLELFGYISADIASGRLPDYTFAGVLDDDPNSELVRNSPGAPFLGTVEDYKVQGDEVVAITIGKPARRQKVARELQEKRMPLFTYIHPSALVASTATLGDGVLICPNTVVNARAHVESNVAVNVFCSVGHGAQIGAHSVLSPFCSMSGDSSLGERGFMGTRATLFPGIKMGNDCTVDSHSAVRKSVKDSTIVSVRGQYLELANRRPV